MTGAANGSERFHLDFDGHRLAYRVSGTGPALVVLSLYRRAADMPQARLLSDRWRVFQIAPLGYGYSDRVPGYAGEALVDQVLAVLDRHDAGRFAVWGYSKGGAMAACIARATPRAAGLICGGFALGDGGPRPGVLRQLDRRLAPDHPSRSLWWWCKEFDWSAELANMAAAALLYWGTDDRQMAKRLDRARGQLGLQHVDFLEFPGLDHQAGNASPALEDRVVPGVAHWLSDRLGPSW